MGFVRAIWAKVKEMYLLTCINFKAMAINKDIVHKAFKRNQIAVLYYKKFRKIDLSPQNALVRFDLDNRIDLDVLESVINDVINEQKKLF